MAGRRFIKLWSNFIYLIISKYCKSLNSIEYSSHLLHSRNGVRRELEAEFQEGQDLLLVALPAPEVGTIVLG
jgi:hypothetical protein